MADRCCLVTAHLLTSGWESCAFYMQIQQQCRWSALVQVIGISKGGRQQCR